MIIKPILGIVIGAVLVLVPHAAAAPTVTTTTTVPVTTTTARPFDPMILLPAKTRRMFTCIMFHESSSTPGNYHPTDVNPTSGAAGIFQFVDGTWQRYAGELGITTRSAAQSSVRDQFRVTALFYAENGSYWAWEGDGCV
jgi:hypothetical protein